MDPLLFLCHRIPYPPNKGDKVRSYHLLRYLARHFRVHLGAFVDDPDDWQHEEALRSLCADVCLRPLAPRAARLKSLDGLRTGEALSLPYYRDARLHAWVDAVLSSGVRRALAFSSPMAMYLRGRSSLRTVVDFVDVDSAKWGEYSRDRTWPLSWIYKREAERLLAFERAIAAEVNASVLVTQHEVDLFLRLAPEVRGRVHAVQNGVDHEYFRCDPARPSPYSEDEEPIVFTGAMDYWPNVDAACWFAREVMPSIVAVRPRARFWVVGMNPAANVLALRSDCVTVTGRVDDVRPYVQHARVVVAPLRVARGVQNKVLEAMALGKVVVASETCAAPIGARGGHEIETADSSESFATKVIASLADEREQELGPTARRFVVERFDWDRNLAAFGELLQLHVGSARAAPQPSSSSLNDGAAGLEAPASTASANGRTRGGAVLASSRGRH